MRYTKGDKVVIRDDLKSIIYGKNSFVKGMKKGEIVIIKSSYDDQYKIGDGYFYTEEMIDHEATKQLKEPQYEIY